MRVAQKVSNYCQNNTESLNRNVPSGAGDLRMFRDANMYADRVTYSKDHPSGENDAECDDLNKDVDP